MQDQEPKKADAPVALAAGKAGGIAAPAENLPDSAGLEPDNIEGSNVSQAAEDNGSVGHNCPFPGCNFHTGRIQALHGHIQFKHEMKGEHMPVEAQTEEEQQEDEFEEENTTPPAPAATPVAQQLAPQSPAPQVSSPPTPAPPQKQPYVSHKFQDRGSKMNQLRPAPRATESEQTDIGKKAEVRGRVKQVLKIIASAEPEKSELLAPQREMCIEYIKALNKADVSEETLGEIESNLDSVIKPEVKNVLEGPTPAKSPQQKPSLQAGIMNMTRIANIRGKVKRAIADYFKLSTPRKDELSSEKEVLVSMSQKLSSSELTQKELEEFESYFESEIAPAVSQALLADTKKPPVAQTKPGEDIVESEIAQRKQELELERADRMLEEEKLRRRQNMMAIQNVGSQGNSLVPIISPRLNDRGEIVKDDKGNVMMETKYAPVDQAKGSNELMMMMLMSGKLGGGNDFQSQMMTTMMNNNTAILTALIESNKSKKEGASPEELVLRMQNEQMKFMMTLEEKRQGKGEDPNIKAMRDELRANREDAAKMREAMYSQQLQYMGKEMEDLKHYAYRDPLEDIKKKREQLEELGIISPKDKDAEQEALKESSKLMEKGIQKIDTVSNDVKYLLAPLVKAQAAALERQSGGGAPLQRTVSERDKVAAYRNMLNNLEEEEEEGEEEEA